MYWFVYILTSLFISYILSCTWKKYRYIIFLASFVALITPAKINISESYYAPAIFTFLFNSLFEMEYSLRVLRPLILTVPISVIIFFILKKIKKRFFLSQNYLDL